MAASLAEVEASRPEGLTDAAARLTGSIVQLDRTMTAEQRELALLAAAWQGQAFAAAMKRAQQHLADQRRLRRKLTVLQSAMAAGGSQLSSVRSAVMSVVGGLRARGWLVTDAGTAIAPPFPAIFKLFESAFTSIIQHLLAMFAQVDQATAAAINGANRVGSEQVSFGLGAGGAPPLSPQHGQPEPENNRHRNQIDAFKAATGRQPVTENDWRSAAMLDSHNYLEKNAGVNSNVVVGHIKPVHGQGTVQTNLFIPGEEAWYPDIPGGISGHNFGDNRGFNPNAGPEDSRVALFVDYENGLVIARQNPSVDTGGNGVKAGTPQINVSQNPNGSVRIGYKAADPFPPGGDEAGKAGPWNVNGELVIKPTASGPIAGGIVSDFPAIEIYQHGAEGTSEIAKIMPQNITQGGPLAGLPFSQNIGTPLLAEFPETLVPPPPGIPNVAIPSQSGELPVVRPPVPIVIPYPSVDLGPVEDHVRVPVGK